MDLNANPFSPGAGAPPPELVGRDDILGQARLLLERTRQGRTERSFFLTGLRGVGKTVLLVEIERMASAAGYRTILVEAHEDKTLPRLLAPPLRKLLFDLDRMANAANKAKRALAVLKGFVGSIRVGWGDFDIGLGIDPERGTADSGDLEADLPELFVAVAEAAQERGIPVILLIDEMQYLGEQELGALIMAMHKLQQRTLPLVLVGAGLPILPALAGNAKSYAERLFTFPSVGPLTRDQADRALDGPVARAEVHFDAQALREIYRMTQGYPYFIQEWGYQTWNVARASPIDKATVDTATPEVIHRLDGSFFKVRFDRLNQSEKNFLRAMAALGPGPHKTGDVAEELGIKTTSMGPTRASLLRKGMIYGPAHGQMAFTVPLFDEFMLRAMPEGRRKP